MKHKDTFCISDLYSLRCHHKDLVNLCLKASRICLPESLELFAAIVSQYRGDYIYFSFLLLLFSSNRCIRVVFFTRSESAFFCFLVSPDEGRLPEELVAIIADGLPGLLVPPAMEPGKSGLQWVT